MITAQHSVAGGSGSKKRRSDYTPSESNSTKVTAVEGPTEDDDDVWNEVLISLIELGSEIQQEISKLSQFSSSKKI